jgi:conjugal transfer/entry exclusion protein
MEATMSRWRWVILLLFVNLSVAPLGAQLVVIDPANLAQTILIAERTYDQYDQLRREFEIIQRMAQKLGTLDRYRIPAIGITGHDPSRWAYGRPWIQALNSGDARGTAYFQSVLPLERPLASDLSRLSPMARRDFASRYATTEITDSVALMGAHQVALVRGYFGKLQDAAQNLEHDVLSRQPGTHEMTAVLDKIAAGELLGRRQDTATNQLLSHALEQLLARSKRLRDTEAGNMNMQLEMWRDGRAANDAFVRGAGDALRTWRQP